MIKANDENILSQMFFVVFLSFLLSAEVITQRKPETTRDLYEERDFLWSLNVNKGVIARFTPSGNYIFYNDMFGPNGEHKGNLTFVMSKSGEVVSRFVPCSGEEFGMYTFRRNEAFNALENLVAISCFAKGVEIWNFWQGKIIARFSSRGGHPSISPDGTRVVTTDVLSTDPPELWDVENQQRIAFLPASSTLARRAPLAVSFSPDSNRVAIAYYVDVYIWDTRSGRLLIKLDDQEASSDRNWIDQSPESRIYDMSFTSDGKTIITGTGRSIKFWDAATGKLKFTTSEGHKNLLNDLAISPDEKILATATKDKVIKLWDMKTGKLIRTLLKPYESTQNIYFSPDGTCLVYRAWGSQREIIYNVETGKILWQGKYGTADHVISPRWDMVLIKDFKQNVIRAYRMEFCR